MLTRHNFDVYSVQIYRFEYHKISNILYYERIAEKYLSDQLS